MLKASSFHSLQLFVTNAKRRLMKFPVQLALLLLFMTILRLPNFSEPYWYGDEAIYLTIGQALNDGRVLYQDIIDHKTPLIYYFARADSQFNFRILLYVWMLITTSAWFFVARKLWRSTAAAFWGGFLFVLLTTLPWFEGHIPNGELFVMGFVLVGLFILQQTAYWRRFMEKKSTPQPIQLHPWIEPSLLIISGSMFGLAILTKVPAVFDYLAVATLGWFTLTNYLLLDKLRSNWWQTLIWPIIKAELWILVGLALPILISILYFVLIGAGQAYLDFGLLYNFRYAGNWDLGLNQAWLAFWFSLPGKALFLLLLLSILSIFSKKIRPSMQWLLMWSSLTLVASLLSNRPYPHYFLQIMPPFTLMFAGVCTTIFSKKHSFTNFLLQTRPTLAFGALCIYLMMVMKLAPYSAQDYYQNYWRFITKDLSIQEYFQSFNPMMTDNYQAATYLKNLPGDTLFIWGTNPMLYALSERHPVGRFTVAFHIHDFDAYQETIASIHAHQPQAIVVMKDESVPLPGLNNFLFENYHVVKSYDHFLIWQNKSL